MKFYGDYHTHTYFSDCTNTVKKVVEAAREKGLKEVAITDHGFCNKWLSLTPKKYARQTKRVEECRKLYDDITVLQGIETDILDEAGTVDIQPDELMKMDIMLCGFHRFVDSTSYRQYFKFVIYNGFLSGIFKPKADTVERNTKAYIAAIEKYPIDVLAHLNNRAKVDVGRVCEAAAKHGTMIELNIKHLELVDDNIEAMLNSGCTFIVNSDAHKLSAVGAFDKAKAVIEKYGIPEERIANLDKRPVFTRLNEYKKARIENGQAKL